MARERPQWTYWAAGLLGAALLRVLRLTWRVHGSSKKFILKRHAERAGRPGSIYVHWHSRILIGAAMTGGAGLRVLVSQHGDGEYIVRAIERLGFGTIRGSTTRGGLRALLEMVRVLEAGNDIAVTPDGPKGPRCRVQQGCVIAASKSGATIVPVGFEISRSKRLRSWDRFQIPSAFAKVAIVMGEPIEVPPDLDADGVETWRRTIEERILEMTRQAAEIAGIPAETPDVDPLETPAARQG
jgi:lysophospholipid acyltransferase (LPLAT)-like uncharacterized protein